MKLIHSFFWPGHLLLAPLWARSRDMQLTCPYKAKQTFWIPPPPYDIFETMKEMAEIRSTFLLSIDKAKPGQAS